MIGEMIKFCDPVLRFRRHDTQIKNIVAKVIAGDQLILGDEVAKFETQFAEYIGVDYCVGVGSGTDALCLSMIALGVKRGDEVITSGLTTPATAVAIINAGATPVIVDVEPESYCIDPVAIRAAVTTKTVGIIPVHLHGRMAAMASICQMAQEYGLWVIEDCAQAHGSSQQGGKAGTWGDVGAFSFYPTKNLGCLGDGGAIVTRHADLHNKLRSLRNYGFDRMKMISIPGRNSRLDELQAAILSFFLTKIDEYNLERRSYAQRYDHLLEPLPLVRPLISEEENNHQFCIQIDDRDVFRSALLNSGISTGIHYPRTLGDHPALRPFSHDLPVARQLVQRLVSLPIQPEVLQLHFSEIVEKIFRCCQG